MELWSIWLAFFIMVCLLGFPDRVHLNNASTLAFIIHQAGIKEIALLRQMWTLSHLWQNYRFKHAPQGSLSVCSRCPGDSFGSIVPYLCSFHFNLFLTCCTGHRYTTSAWPRRTRYVDIVDLLADEPWALPDLLSKGLIGW